jgi:hypothetical protein
MPPCWRPPVALTHLLRLTYGMFIRRVGEGNWHAPETTAYTNEAELQDLLAETPSLLPGVGEEPAAAARELPVAGAGSADVVIVTASGDITLVECKLHANPEIRRQVVGQLLAYASAIWHMSFADLDDAFRRSAAKRSLSDAFVDGREFDAEEFRQAVGDNLASGSMRLIIAVDEITEELKRIVTYLNAHTTQSVELLALEMRRAVDQNVEVLLPATYGEESVRVKNAARGQFDKDAVIAATRDAYRDASQQAVQAAERMLDLMHFMEEQGARMSYGKRGTPAVMAWLGEGAANPVVVRFAPRSFSVQFVFMRDAGRSQVELERFADLLRKIPGLAPYYKALAQADYGRAPELRPEELLKSDEILVAFKHAVVEGAQPRSDLI